MPSASPPRMTTTTRLVLHVLLAEPEREQYGLEIGANAGLASGTIHPILARLERCGWVDSYWEDIEPSRVGRPARRYYRLSGAGAQAARSALARRRPLPGFRLGTGTPTEGVS